MLEIGNGHMTEDENRTEMSLWSLPAAPLIAGNDLRRMTAATKEILLNQEVIAVDQYPLGRQATRLYRRGNEDVWTKPLSGAELAVGVFNRGDAALQVTITSNELRLSEGAQARDVWKQETVSIRDGQYRISIAAHGVLLLRVKELQR